MKRTLLLLALAVFALTVSASPQTKWGNPLCPPQHVCDPIN